MPELIAPVIFRAAIEKSTPKLGPPPQSLRLESYNEGPSLQILHIGSYGAEGPVLLCVEPVRAPALSKPT